MSKFVLFFIFVFSFLFASYGQFKDDIQTDEEIIFGANPKRPPQFPGGPSAWNKYISENVETPEIIRKSRATTTVYVEATITRAGKIVNPKIVRGNFDVNFNEQLIKALLNSPNWEPARIKKDSVATKIVIPIIVK